MPKHLSIDNALDGNLKPVKDSDGTPCALEISSDKARVKSLEISGEAEGQTPTTGDGLATKQYVDDNAGGGGYWIQSWSARFYTRYDNWFYGSSLYGLNNFQWSTNRASSTLEYTWLDSWNPQLVVPKDCTLKEYNYTGSFSSSQTYQAALVKIPKPTYGSDATFNMEQIGSTQEVVATSNRPYSLGETGLSENLVAGDMLLPALRRTTTDNSTYYYFYMCFSIVCEVS